MERICLINLYFPQGNEEVGSIYVHFHGIPGSTYELSDLDYMRLYHMNNVYLIPHVVMFD